MVKRIMVSSAAVLVTGLIGTVPAFASPGEQAVSTVPVATSQGAATASEHSAVPFTATTDTVTTGAGFTLAIDPPHALFS